jgi:uncharacterized membrane protein YebE (DUF533 family)
VLVADKVDLAVLFIGINDIWFGKAPPEEFEKSLRAMVAAAKADGDIDAAERGRIAGRVREAGAGGEALEFLMAELQQPLDLPALAAQVRGPEEAVEVYAASLLAIEVDSDAERAYLARLAQSTGLDAGTVGQIHTALGVPAPA